MFSSVQQCNTNVTLLQDAYFKNLSLNRAACDEHGGRKVTETSVTEFCSALNRNIVPLEI